MVKLYKINYYRSLGLSTLGMKGTSSFCLLTGLSKEMNKSFLLPSLGLLGSSNYRSYSLTSIASNNLKGSINVKGSLASFASLASVGSPASVAPPASNIIFKVNHSKSKNKILHIYLPVLVFYGLSEFNTRILDSSLSIGNI